MKNKLLMAALGAAALIAALGGCGDGAGDSPEVSPITFTGTWVDPTWVPETDPASSDSRGGIFAHLPAQKIAQYSIDNSSIPPVDIPVPAGRVFTVNPDWTFSCTGGFSQYPITIGLATIVPPLVVEGMITYEGDLFYRIPPTRAYVNLERLRVLDPDQADVTLPPDTVASFQEYARISYGFGDKLVIDDMPETATNAKGILRGIWTEQ